MKLEVEYWKLHMNQKSLKLVVAMDAHKFKIATKWAKHFKKENADLYMKLHS
jgi:hypothetical protein